MQAKGILLTDGSEKDKKVWGLVTNCITKKVVGSLWLSYLYIYYSVF